MKSVCCGLELRDHASQSHAVSLISPLLDHYTGFLASATDKTNDARSYVSASTRGVARPSPTFEYQLLRRLQLKHLRLLFRAHGSFHTTYTGLGRSHVLLVDSLGHAVSGGGTRRRAGEMLTLA